jgi:cyclic pyranopterin phosphate synthase
MEKYSSIEKVLESKNQKINVLTIRVDKTVPGGATVNKRICNENCVFVKKFGIACHGDNSYRGTGVALSNKELVKMVIKIHQAVEIPINVHIAGDGEPTLFEDELIDFIKMLRELDFVKIIKLTTNGTRLSHGIPSLAERLKLAGVDEINVSLHSLDRNGFKEVTGIDALPIVMSGIKTAIASGIKTSINCVIREETFKELQKYIELSSELGLRVKFFGILDNSGKYQKYADELLQKMKDLLMQIADKHVEYYYPYAGVLFQIGNAIIDLKDSTKNVCPIINCKFRSLCREGCWYQVRLSPTGIMQPCGIRTDNLLDLRDTKIPKEEILNKLIESGKILKSGIKIGGKYGNRNEN